MSLQQVPGYVHQQQHQTTGGVYGGDFTNSLIGGNGVEYRKEEVHRILAPCSNNFNEFLK